MKPQKLFCILLAIWVLADLLQAAFTPLHADEAYYALYGQHLDWGYFDHPPMVALLTAFSNLLFKRNFSIRFATVLLHGATVWIIWKTLSDRMLTTRDVWVFFAVAASLVMFSVYGCMTTPDVPLLFFTALFLYLYKRYLHEPKWSLAIALGAVFAALLYSKYMGVLVVGFVLLSNFKLLKDSKIWVALAFAALLFVPHVLWQIHHGFPSLQYHLLDRNEVFRLQYPLEYSLFQLLVFNPVCIGLSAYFCWKKRKTGDLFERACVFNVAGFVLFFWLMTVKGHAEPHWTVAASVPMLLLLWEELREERWRKWVTRTIVPVLGVIFVLRIAAALFLDHPLLGLVGNKDDYEAVHKHCGDTPAVFVGSFQKPSLYHFYTGERAASLSSFFGRQTQFDIWQFDKELQGKHVFILDSKVFDNGYNYSEFIQKDLRALFLVRETYAFQGANRIQVTVDDCTVKDDTLWLGLTMYNPYTLDYDFSHPEFPTTLYIGFLKDGCHETVYCPLPPDMVIPSDGFLRVNTFSNVVPDAPFVICLDNSICRSVNSKGYKVNSKS